MKTTKVNHSEILESLKAEYNNLMNVREDARDAWLEARSLHEPWYMELWEEYHKTDKEKARLEKEIRFHEIMLQDKKYATRHGYSDAQAYEIIEEKSEKLIIVRQMTATLTEKAQKALRESFTPGGFMGHTDNSLQEWDCKSDETAPLISIRKRKNGKWFNADGSEFTIEPQPRHFYDYNF